MTWDKRAITNASTRTFRTPHKAAPVIERVRAIQQHHKAAKCRCGATWGTCHPLTAEDYDALQVEPITGDRWDRTQGGDRD